MNPTLPLYHFQESKNSSDFNELPTELLHQVLARYSDWGELAKLATVKRSWKNLVNNAADFGGLEATWELAEALLDGKRGLACNPNLAVKYLLQLAQHAKKPFAPAMKKLAKCYFTGCGVVKNNTKGLHWLEEAHELGQDSDAAHQLAVVYEYGEYDVTVDVVAAADWFHKAAVAGHVEAMAEYAMCCELGCGREQSDEEALEWYMKAANKGHVTANFSVGEAFEEARGVPQSDQEACLWYYKAAVEGDEDSKRALRRLGDIARIILPGVAGILEV